MITAYRVTLTVLVAASAFFAFMWLAAPNEVHPSSTLGYSACDEVNAPELCDDNGEDDIVDVAMTIAPPAPRLSGHGVLLEDEAPYAGVRGGALVNFGDGIACYSDHSATDGYRWFDVKSCGSM